MRVKKERNVSESKKFKNIDNSNLFCSSICHLDKCEKYVSSSIMPKISPKIFKPLRNTQLCKLK